MYHVLEPDLDLDIVAGIKEPAAGLAPKYLQGIKLPKEEALTHKRVTIETTMDEYPDYIMTLHGPVVSGRFLAALQGAGADNFDAYRAEVTCPEGELAQYFVWNVIGRIACLNRARAELTFYRQKIARIKRLAIDDDRAQGAKLFRLDDEPAVLLVSSDVHAALAPLSGLVFADAEGWSDERWF